MTYNNSLITVCVVCITTVSNKLTHYCSSDRYDGEIVNVSTVYLQCTNTLYYFRNQEASCAPGYNTASSIV